MNDEFQPITDIAQPGEEIPSGGPGRRTRRYKMVWVLMLVLLVVGIVPLLAVSSRLIDLNKNNIKTQQQVNQHQLASSVAHHIESFVDGQSREMQILAEFLAAEMVGHNDAEFLERLAARRFLSRFVDRDLVLIRYTHRDGTFVTSNHEGFEIDKTLTARLTDVFARQMNTGSSSDIAVGVPFHSPRSGGPSVILSTPVTHDGRRVGVLSALLGLGPIWADAQRRSAYMLFALDGEGHLFTSEDSVGLPGVRVENLELVKEFVATGGSRVMPYEAEVEDGRRVSLIGAYSQTRQGWGVFVQESENAVYSMVEAMRRDSYFHAGVAAAGAVLLGFLFAGWVSRPIKRLADSTLAFADGDFHSRVSIRSGHEVGELADTFNAMAEALEGYIARLKHAAEENRELFIGSVQALAAAIDAKDKYTRGHSERVRRYAAILARCMGLPAEEVQKVEIGALLHDVGKIGIEDRILNKPGPLTPEEYEIMKTHPVRGADIMQSIRQLRDVIPAMKHHHERWDGAGYPDGLEAENIPFQARLVTIVDCWDAMTTNRPYQKAMSLEDGIERLQVLSGKVFDPQVVEGFVSGLQQGEFDAVFEEARRQVEATESAMEGFEPDQTTAAVARDNFDPDCIAPSHRPR